MSSLDAASERRVWLLDFVYFVDVVPGARQVVAHGPGVRVRGREPTSRGAAVRR